MDDMGNQSSAGVLALVIAYTPDAGGIWTLLVENFDEDGFKLD
jgi:hypothetical protein